MTYNVTGIFPIPIYSSTINVSENINTFVNTLKYNQNYYNKVSDSKYILNSYELIELKTKISEHLTVYCKEILCIDNVELDITHSWVTHTSTNEQLHMHNHTNSIISGVLYICPDFPSSIIFQKDLSFFSMEHTTYNQYNSRQFSVETKKNMLLLFPSNLLHQVAVNNSIETRISLVFNTFYKGVIGNVDATTRLEINNV
jgi:uncharacterized protein (TIGR02466 family)